MSEKTTIGGIVYEAVGSSSSNLLLKCNGTARIQWGNKLIDLIKNGKIASEDSKELIFNIKDESEIKSDGIYVLTTEESDQLLVYKDGNKYNFTNTDLYISTSTNQNLTVEQKEQALNNIGFYYNTLIELQNSGIKKGIVYVLENDTLYIINNGIIKEFEAKLKTVTVEKKDDIGETINSAVKVVLSILDEEYLILADLRITANYSIHVKNSAQIGSEGADKNLGYRLYIEGNTSYLDVDRINVRLKIENVEYIEVTYEELRNLLALKNLVPHEWYLIKDYQNHWKLLTNNEKWTRPILVRALFNDTLYRKGYLFKNHNIEIEYDPYYETTPIKQMNADGTEYLESTVNSRGRIVWMRDIRNNNLASFDFLDYLDAFGNYFNGTVLHTDYPDIKEEDYSIFPEKSYNNNLVVNNLFGTIVDSNGLFSNSGASSIILGATIMHDNYIECSGEFKILCNTFTNNTITYAHSLQINADVFNNNNIYCIYNISDYSEVLNFVENFHVLYKKMDLELYYKFIPVLFLDNCENNVISNVYNSYFNSSLKSCKLTNIQNCRFNNKVEEFTLKYLNPHVDYWGEVFIHEFYEITNTVIDSINSVDGKIYLRELYDCVIGSIYAKRDEEVKIQGSLKNCTINSINSNVIISSNIKDTTINTIENTTISEIIDNCSINNIKKLTLLKSLVNSTFEDFFETEINGKISDSNFKTISNSFIYATIENSNFKNITTSTIQQSIENSYFDNITSCYLYSSFNNSTFRNISNVTFNEGIIKEVVSYCDLNSTTFSEIAYNLLYNSTKRKEIYKVDDSIKIICLPDNIFYRGMIIMHSGIEPIPKGWAMCDGKEYEFNGVKTITPNLTNRFIKSIEYKESFTENTSQIKSVDINENNEITLTKENLPKHEHPHTHTFDVSDTTSNSFYALVGSTSLDAVSSVDGGTLKQYVDSVNGNDININNTINISGETSNVIDKDTTEWPNKAIKIEPNYYSLIFIMKL